MSSNVKAADTGSPQKTQDSLAVKIVDRIISATTVIMTSKNAKKLRKKNKKMKVAMKVIPLKKKTNNKTNSKRKALPTACTAGASVH